VKAEKRPSAQQVQEVGVRIADALAATHARGVLHRDVKPANILIDSYGHAGLADFGLAAVPDPGMESEAFEAITPAYAPPEVLNRKSPTEVGDVYSLGATLYALLAGHPPRWPGRGMPTVAEMLQRQEQPIERIPDVPDSLMDVLLRAMATDPAGRPSAAQFRDQLGAFNLEPPPPEARRAVPVPAVSAEAGATEPATDPWPTKSGQRSRHRRSAILVATVVVLAAALMASLVSLLPLGGRPVAGTTPSQSLPISPTGARSTPASSKTPANSPAPTPTPTANVPGSYLDCSDQLGRGTYCTPEPECWGGVRGYADSPLKANGVGCDGIHYYQTFAAGILDFVPISQSTLERMRPVRKVCNRKVLNKMLDPQHRSSEWDIEMLGPQHQNEMFYRCVFGYHERTGQLQLSKPR
jgi:hypothetical protein